MGNLSMTLWKRATTNFGLTFSLPLSYLKRKDWKPVLQFWNYQVSSSSIHGVVVFFQPWLVQTSYIQAGFWNLGFFSLNTIYCPSLYVTGNYHIFTLESRYLLFPPLVSKIIWGRGSVHASDLNYVNIKNCIYYS